MWKFTGQQRPDFAETPALGQESVWDYPRPPDLVASSERIEVRVGEIVLASTNSSFRVRETASPPTYYLPPSEVIWDHFAKVDHKSFCEWKGTAGYLALKQAPEKGVVGWFYDGPSERFAAIDGFASFYPGKVECYVDGERVRPQPGEFYGGWVTDRICGPFKGEPGTGHW